MSLGPAVNSEETLIAVRRVSTDPDCLINSCQLPTDTSITHAGLSLVGLSSNQRPQFGGAWIETVQTRVCDIFQSNEHSCVENIKLIVTHKTLRQLLKATSQVTPIL